MWIDIKLMCFFLSFSVLVILRLWWCSTARESNNWALLGVPFQRCFFDLVDVHGKTCPWDHWAIKIRDISPKMTRKTKNLHGFWPVHGHQQPKNGDCSAARCFGCWLSYVVMGDALPAPRVWNKSDQVCHQILGRIGLANSEQTPISSISNWPMPMQQSKAPVQALRSCSKSKIFSMGRAPSGFGWCTSSTSSTCKSDGQVTSQRRPMVSHGPASASDISWIWLTDWRSLSSVTTVSKILSRVPVAPRGSPWLPVAPNPTDAYSRLLRMLAAKQLRLLLKLVLNQSPQFWHFLIPLTILTILLASHCHLGSFSASQNQTYSPPPPDKFRLRHSNVAPIRSNWIRNQTARIKLQVHDQSLNPWNLALRKARKTTLPIHNTKTFVRAMSCWMLATLSIINTYTYKQRKNSGGSGPLGCCRATHPLLCAKKTGQPDPTPHLLLLLLGETRLPGIQNPKSKNVKKIWPTWFSKRLSTISNWFGSVSKPCTPGEHQNSW